MNKENEEPKVEKKEYASPVLTSYGTLANKTNGMGTVGSDGVIGSKNRA